MEKKKKNSEKEEREGRERKTKVPEKKGLIEDLKIKRPVNGEKCGLSASAKKAETHQL